MAEIRFQNICLLYTSDAADETGRVDLGGRGIIKKILTNFNISLLDFFD